MRSLGNDYEYLRLQLNAGKRFFLVFGYSDVSLVAGKIFGLVSWPLLFLHRANQTYSYQRNSYNLMNFLEFVSDHYVSMNVDHNFNGFFLNKIPLINRLKLREVASFKMLYGGISANNDPDFQNSLLKFPTDDNGVPLTYAFGKQPYIEASIGLANIFRIFRVDLVRRFTYLDHPGISSTGIRFLFGLNI